MDDDEARRRYEGLKKRDRLRRFSKLPSVEQMRLVHLVEYIGKGRPLDRSLLAGFPAESKALLLEMLEERMEKEGL